MNPYFAQMMQPNPFSTPRGGMPSQAPQLPQRQPMQGGAVQAPPLPEQGQQQGFFGNMMSSPDQMSKGMGVMDKIGGGIGDAYNWLGMQGGFGPAANAGAIGQGAGGLFNSMMAGGGAGAAGGASITGGLASMAAPAAGAGAAAGAAGAGASMAGLAEMAPYLLMLASDMRLKDNIKRIGYADNGLPIYSFRYKGSPATHIGFMAQEVQKLNPQAVGKMPNGYLGVDYARASQ